MKLSLSLSLFLVFIAVRLEKLSSYGYVVENGSKVEIALVARMGNSSAAVNQKLSKGRSANQALNHDLVSVRVVPPVSVKSCPFQQLMLSCMGP